MKSKITTLLIASVLFVFASCGDDCIECQNAVNGDSFEACDDGTNFTDDNGNQISFDEIPESWSRLDYTCN